MLTTNTPILTNSPSSDASIFKGIEDAITNFEESIKKYYRTLVDYAKGTGQTRDAAVSLVNNDQVKLYVNRNFKELAKTDLKNPINNDGDTIIHLIAFNNDREAFENIRRENSKALSYDVINNPNKKGELPIHYAMKGRKNVNDNSFIDYMINDLKANPNIPNSNSQVIVREKNKENELKIADDENIKKLNEMIMANVENLTKLTGQTGSSCGYNNNNKTAPISNVQNNDRDFIIKLTNMYAKKNLAGGYSGKRQIRGYKSDQNITESGNNDSFVTKNKNDMLNNRNNNNDLSSDDLYTEYSDEQSVSNNRRFKKFASTDILTPDLDFTDYRSSRDARASVNNPNASRASRESMQRVKKFEDDWMTDDFDLNTINNNNDAEENTSEIDTEYIRNNAGNERTYITNISNERRSDFNDEDDDVNYEDDDDDDDDDTFDVPDDDDDYITSQDRTKNRSNIRRAMNNRSSDRASSNRRPRPQRDAKIDEVYRNFLQQIIDKLGVDDQTARTYRSAIKILIERDNPELRGRENDSLKVKKMEEIIGDDKQFKAIIKRVDAELDDIKRFMEERRQEAEKRKKEWQERRKNMTPSDSKSSDKKSADNKITDTTTESSDKPARKKKSKVNESGYLESDEIIISPSN